MRVRVWIAREHRYQISTSISGESYGERDLAAWRAWLSRAIA